MWGNTVPIRLLVSQFSFYKKKAMQLINFSRFDEHSSPFFNVLKL